MSSARPPLNPSKSVNPTATSAAAATPVKPSRSSLPNSLTSSQPTRQSADSTAAEPEPDSPVSRGGAAASHYADLASLPASDNSDSIPVEVELFENQRLFPIVGWSKNLLPTDRAAWSDQSGTQSKQFNDFKNPLGWSWTGDWTIDKRDSDVDGWKYSTEFSAPAANWTSVTGDGSATAKSHKVRRRRWYRTRKNTGNVRLPDNNNKTVQLPSKSATSSPALAGVTGPTPSANRKGNSISVNSQIPQTSAESKSSETKSNNNNPSSTESIKSTAASSSTLPAASNSSRAPSALSSFYTRPTGPNTLSNVSTRREIIKVSLYYYQRYYPIMGWTDKLLPSDKGHWLDEKGNKCSGKESEEKLELGWKWITEWEIDHGKSAAAAAAAAIKETPAAANKEDGGKSLKKLKDEFPPIPIHSNDEFDSDGYQYCSDYSGPFTPKKSYDQFLRRRHYIRLKEKIETKENQQKKFIMKIFQRLDALKNDLKSEEKDNEKISLSAIPSISVNS